MAFVYTDPFEISEPAATLAADSPIILQLKTGTFLDEDDNSAGRNAKTRFNFVDLMRDNFSVKIATKFGYTKTFYAKDYPVRPEYFLSRTLKDANGSTLTTNGLGRIAQTFAESIERDIILSQNYYINYSATTVTLTSRQQSDRFTLDTAQITIKNEAGSTTSTGITKTVISAGADGNWGSYIGDYELYTEVFTDTSINSQYGLTLNRNNFNRITEVTLPFLPDNDHRFDLSTICKSFVFTTKPNFDLTGSTQETNYMHPFLFQYGESFPMVAGSPSTRRKNIKGITGFKWVLNASVDFNTANDLSVYVASTGRKFLSNAPLSKKSTKASSELLYFIIDHDILTDCKVYGDIIFWDGSKLLNQELYNLETDDNNFGGCYIIPAGYNQVGLNEIETANNKKIKTVTMQLKTSGATIGYSEKKTYRYDFNQQTSTLNVAFLNSMGTFDTFSFTGLKTEDITRETSTYTVPLVFNTNGAIIEGSKNIASYDTRVTKKLVVNSGFITQSEFDWLIDIMKSNVIYSYNEIDNFLKLDNFKYVKSSQSNEYNIECTFTQSVYLNNVSI